MKGEKVDIKSTTDAIRLGIETIYQDSALVTQLSISRNLFLGRELTKGPRFMNRLDQPEMNEVAQTLLRQVGITKNIPPTTPISSLSGGERQAVAIARAMHFDSDLIVLDEPTNNLGVAETQGVLSFVRNARDSGHSCIFIAHNIHHVFRVVDRIVVLRAGQVVADDIDPTNEHHRGGRERHHRPAPRGSDWSPLRSGPGRQQPPNRRSPRPDAGRERPVDPRSIDPAELDLAPELGSASYRIGIIGAGGIVSGCHLPAYRSQGWEVVRIASRTAARARAVAEEFAIPAWSDDILDVIRDDRVEVVDLVLPDHLHREVAEAAFAAGKHVLCQKPMATTLDDARAIVEAGERAGRVLAVNQNGRWDPAIRACGELLRRGVFGQLVTASIEMRTRQPWQEYWKDAEHYPRLMLLGMSIHHLDQFRYLFGDPVEVTAVTAMYPGQPWAGDSIAIYILRYASGLLATGFDDGFPWTRDWSEKYRIEGLDAIARGSIGWPTRRLLHARVHHPGPSRFVDQPRVHPQVVPRCLRGHHGRAVPGDRDGGRALHLGTRQPEHAAPCGGGVPVRS